MWHNSGFHDDTEARSSGRVQALLVLVWPFQQSSTTSPATDDKATPHTLAKVLEPSEGICSSPVKTLLQWLVCQNDSRRVRSPENRHRRNRPHRPNTTDTQPVQAQYVKGTPHAGEHKQGRSVGHKEPGAAPNNNNVN